MTVMLNLRDDIVQRLREKAAQNGQTLEVFLEQLAVGSATEGCGIVAQSPVPWDDAWRSWAASHRKLELPADDSRERIYADRDE